MKNVYFNVLKVVAKFITAEGTLLFCVLSLISLSLTFYLLLRKDTSKKRRYFIVYALVFSALELFLSAFLFITFNSFNISYLIYSALLLSVFIVGLVPFFITASKKVKVKEEHKKLIKLIDAEIEKPEKSEPIYEQLKAMRTPKIEEIKVEEKPKRPIVDSGCEIDFSHVKNVITRVSSYDLSVPEKRQINELLFYIQKAEAGDNNKQVKDNINEGLGAILKIMAKHSL